MARPARRLGAGDLLFLAGGPDVHALGQVQELLAVMLCKSCSVS